MRMDILRTTWQSFLGSLPALVVGIVVARVVHSYLSSELIERFARRGLRENLVLVSIMGLLAPGPLAAYLPLLRALRSTGLHLSLVATFITAQTLAGPMRLFLEVACFGAWFYAYRVVVSFIIAIIVGAAFHFLERRGVF